MRIGIVKEIYRFPVKSMAGEKLDDCTVGRLGIIGDRGWAIRDETTREMTEGGFSPLLMQCTARYREAPAPGFFHTSTWFFRTDRGSEAMRATSTNA